MRSPDKLDIIQWVLILVSVGIALFVWSQLSLFRKQAEDLARKSATANAQLLVIRDTMIANRDFFSDFRESMKAVCGSPTAALQTACRNLNPQWTAFLDAYTQAAIDRAMAQKPEDFLSVEKSYRSTLPLLKEAVADSDAGSSWKARVLEGIAYAQLKEAAGNPDTAAFKNAESGIVAAAGLDKKSAFVGITALKIACTKKTDAAAVNAQFLDLKTRLTDEVNRVGKLKDAILGQRNASLELQYLQQDSELYYLCRYANLDPA
ncbi:MAG TPA: hypothetical protein VK515_07570 [Rhizomicrobium sp.]|nr:hypothetical protein [Rhizomicrobium sp.]